MKWQFPPAYRRRLMGTPTQRASERAPDLRVPWRAFAMALIGYAFVLRVLYAVQVELMPEETYYWNYSRHLDIGYLDHPPMVAWLIRMGTSVFGGTQIGVRFGALCCGAAAAFFLYRLTRNLFDETSALLALVFAHALPFFFFAGILMTPDAPLTAAWAGSLYFLERALIGGRASAWLWAGLCLGLGMLSKYTIGLLGVGTLLFMLLDPPSRRWFRCWQPYAAVLIATIAFAPVILWNAQHHWASFVFQTSRRLADRPQFSLPRLIGAAIVLMTPTGVAAMVMAFTRRDPRPAHAWRFMKALLYLPLAVFVMFSLRHEVKLDWTGAPWTAAIPALAFGLAESQRGPGTARWLSIGWPATFVVLSLLYGAGLYHLVLGIPGMGYTQHTELIPIGWRELGRQIDAVADDVRTKNGGRFLVVGMDRYAIASELAFYSNDQEAAVARTSAAHLFDSMGLMYEQWFPPQAQRGSTLLLVAWDAESLGAARVEKYVDELEPIRQGVLLRNGSTVRRYYYRVVHGYHAS